MERVGFIGTGTLASALVRGLASLSEPPCREIWISERSRAKSAELAAAFPSLVRVEADAAILASRCQLVFLCEQAEPVLGALGAVFAENAAAVLVSCISTLSLASLASLADLPLARVVRAIPLPSSACQLGTTIVCPPHEPTVRLFNLIGTTHVCEREEQMPPLQAVGCSMGPFFRLLAVSRNWCEKRGVEPQVASEFLASLYRGLVMADVQRVASDVHGYDHLVQEQTKGGFNEQMIGRLESAEAFAAFENGWDALLEQFLAKLNPQE